MVPNDYCLVEIEVPDNSAFNLPLEELPDNWKDIGQPVALRKIGDDFLKKRTYLLMRIPSAIVPEEYNFLLNPQHQGIKKVRILKKTAFDFDERLV